MNRSRLLFAPLAFAAAACSSTANVVDPRPAPERDERVDVVAPHVDGPARSLFEDSNFKRRFEESYLAESEVEPPVTADAREALTEIFELISAEDTDAAIAALKKQIGRKSSAMFDVTLANIYFQTERLDEAADRYRVAVDKFPKFRRAWRNLGFVCSRKGDHVGARGALTRVLELGGTDAMTFGLLGYAHANTGNHLAAESAYRMANLLDPDTIDWQKGLALSLLEQKRFPAAAALFDTLIARFPDRSELWMMQANAFLGSGETLRAAHNFEIVERLGGTTPASLDTLGDIYVNDGLFDLGVDAYLRALDAGNGPGSGNAVGRAVRAGRALVAGGRTDEASRLVAGINAAVGDALDEPTRKDLLRLEARLTAARGEDAESARVLAQIIEMDPLDGEAILNLGRIHASMGEAEKGIFYYERAAQLEAFEAKAKLAHAQLLVDEARFPEAVALLRRVQELEYREDVQSYLEQVERLAQSR